MHIVGARSMFPLRCATAQIRSHNRTVASWGLILAHL